MRLYKAVKGKHKGKQAKQGKQKALKHACFKAFYLAGEEGFEPSAYGFGDRRSTN